MLLKWVICFQGTPSKEADSAKESSKPERPSVLSKRSSQAPTLHHRKPTSSVDAEIIGGSTLSSQAMLKHEVSTASSKGIALKKGMLLCPNRSTAICEFTSYLLVLILMPDDILKALIIGYLCNLQVIG